MAGNVKIEIPDFNFAGFYYPEVYESLIRYKRANCPELTDESRFETSMQLFSAFALTKHLSSVQIDMTAKEGFLRTASLAESVREHLRLIGYEMRSASPAKSVIVYELSQVITATTAVVPEGSRCSTQATSTSEAIFFEADAELTTDRTDQLSRVFAFESGGYTDFSVGANSSNHPADDWVPWASAEVNDAVYFGHTGAMWDRMVVDITTGGTDMQGVWEYYDGNFEKATPDLVTNLGIQLEFDLNGYLGDAPRTGLTVRVSLNSTKASEDAIVTFDGFTNKIQVGLLGQAVPSAEPGDYTVGADWELIEGTDDSFDFTSALGTNTSSVDFRFILPQDTQQNWVRGTVNGVEAFWLRYRLTQVLVPTSPSLAQARIHEGKQYLYGEVTQGRTQVDNPLGSGDGTPDQRYTVTQENVLDGSFEVSVDGLIWDEVPNFLETTADDEVYRIELGENDSATIVFAPVGQGKAPPPGIGNIAAAYRWGADTDGNVGSNTIIVDKAGLTLVNRLFNPRQAFGWSEAQGASESSLEKAKQLGPATLRTLNGTAISPDDVVNLTLNFENDEGTSPFSRAFAVEEMFGPKTIGLVVVASGGGLASFEVLGEVEEYFNGDKFAIPPKPKHIVANQEVTAINYEPVEINVTATVTAPKTVTALQITNALQALLDPEALALDGSWLWDFADIIPESRIHNEIHGVSTLISKVVLTGWVDVELGASQLPTAGILVIEVVQ